MAALEKLVKSLETLKSLISSTTSVDESRKRSKEKMTLCLVITDMICAPDTKKTKNFQPLLSYSMETLFKMCDDTDSSVRMIADECLNRIIRTHMDTNIIKLNIELHNEIKKNQSARSLRAALWRFAELAHLMRPNKAKLCMQSLVRCFTNIAARTEEAVLETTATSMPKILSALGCFMTDSDVKNLLETFVKNLHSENAVLRRTASSIILSICLHCPKPQFFLIHTLTSLLDIVLPLKEDQTSYSILGVLNCIRGLIPHLESDGKETFLYGSFGTKRKHKRQAVLSVDSLIQIYELCLNWSNHSDHNVVASSLETLNELLTHPPLQLVKILVANQGLEKSRIHLHSSSSWKLSNRTLSEISVVAPLDASILLEDSLLENDETQSPKIQWLLDVNEENSLVLPPTSPGNISPNNALDFSDYQDSESVASEDLGLVLKRPKSPDPDMIPLRESPSPILEVENTMVWYIGEAVESNECPLLYCARFLVTNFLILECTNARVSVRSLALNCLTQVVRLNPLLFLQEVDKNGLSTPQGFSHVSDVCNLVDHGDPQLRGLVRVLIGTFINSMYTKYSKSSSDWFTEYLRKDKKLSLEKLINILIDGLNDESSICVRHTLTGLGTCLINLLENDDFSLSVQILEKLLETVENPYWLVKVKLIELLCTLPFQCVHFITNNDFYQKRVLDCIILLLSNDDERVRKATSEGIVNLVKNLYFPSDYGDDVILARAMKSFSFSFKKGLSNVEKEHNEKVLSRLIVILIDNLMVSSSKYLLTGCIEALSLLSEKYIPSEYPKGWQLVTDINSSSNITSSGLFLHTVTLLSNSGLSLDLEIHHHLLKLAGNLLTGATSNASCVDDKKLVAGANSLLVHVMRLLAIFVQVIEESKPSKSLGASPLRRRTSRAASPPKILSGDKEKKEEKKPSMGHIGANPHYSKLKDVVRAGYNNYKLTLEYSGSEKFLTLLLYSLKTMEDLVEQHSIIDVLSLFEELLQYLRITFVLDSASTVQLVNRLLKSLFFNEPKKIAEVESNIQNEGFYDSIFQKCLNDFSENLFSNQPPEKPEKNESEKNQEKMDVEELSRKIKLFEPIVLQSFTEYTMSNNVELQVQVLSLLAQLMCLKVNYCLLDAGLILFKYVKEQLEYLEAGQIRHPELLIPRIFTFFVGLMNKHSQEKTNIGVPQIIQMCDGLMASGQNPVTHSIPALGPVVQYVFMSTTNVNDEKELQTQREVVLAMLFRLAEYPQVLDIIYGLMKEGWRWEEHWKRWYKQVIETIRPLLAEGRLVVNECSTLHALFSLKSNSSPLNNVLLLLFTHQQEGQSLEHWLGMVTTMLFTVCSYREEKVLLQLEEINLYVREEGDDPLKVNIISKTIAPQDLLSKLFMRVIHTSVVQINEIFSEEINISLEKMFSNFLLCCIYIFDSGNYNEVKDSLRVLLKSSEIQEIHGNFVALASSSPILTLLWAQILTVLGIGDFSLWSKLIQKKNSLNYSVVKQGSVLLFCKYLAKNPQDLISLKWLLENEIDLVVRNCQEPPVEEMLNSIYNIEENSEILLNSLSACVRNVEPLFAHRVLQTLKNIHSKYTGSVLLVGMELVEHKNIAIARLSAAFCSRIIEYMLTLENDSVQNLLKKEEIILILKKLTSCTRQYKRHNALISLLKKLGEQVYSTKSSDFESSNEIDLEKILSTKLDKSWLLDQIIKKCNKNVDSDKRKCARLLSQLDVEDLQFVMRNDFNLNILPHCFTIGTQLSLKMSIKDKNFKTPDTLVPLYDCARTVLLFSIAKISKALPTLDSDFKSTKEQLNIIFNKIDIKGDIMPLVKGLINYLNSFKDLLSPGDSILKIMPEQQPENVLKFGLFCLQIINWVVETSKKFDEWPWMCENLLECSSSVLSIDYLSSLLTLESISCISSCLFNLHRSICKKDIPLKDLIDCDNETKEKDVILNTYLEVASLVSSLDFLKCCPVNVYKRFKSIVVSLGRNQRVNWYSRIPVEAWPLPSEKTNLPQVPEHLLHDSEILGQIVNRVRLLGWTDRHQFEEIWVSYLSALNTNPDFENTEQDEITAIMQANSIVIDGITSLVLSTMETPHFQLLHVPRLSSDQLYQLPVWNRLEEMNEILCWKIRTLNNEDKPKLVRVDKRPNLERTQNPNCYNFGQVSVSYLQSRISDDDENLAFNLTKNDKNVDIRSCVQFMLDLFGQWALPNSGISLNLQLSMVKSILCLSDMFTERTHFEWMFNTFVSFLKNHPQQDEILHQYVIIGISKSAAVLNICEGETSEKILKMIDCSLKSHFVPMKIAGLHGLLYLLQNVQNIKKAEPNVEVVKLSSQEFRNKILDMTIDFMYKYSSEENNDDALLILSLGMYLMEVFPDESIDNISTPTMLKVLSPLIQNPKNDFMYLAGIHGLERLVLLGNSGFNEQITRFALDRFSDSDPKISLPALQLLIACIYAEKIKIDNENSQESSDIPLFSMEIMEKTTALFDKINRGYPVEVEIVCEILPGILSDFFPASDVLNKVISEFLSPNQPHKKNMAAMVFQVFTQACEENQLPLLQLWVVHSLKNFLNNLPAVTAVWSLCCFFISASQNPWLKAMFPHVQSRIRQYDFEDRQILCIAAVDFYNQLDSKQQEMFRQSFKDANSTQKSVFSDIISCLR